MEKCLERFSLYLRTYVSVYARVNRTTELSINPVETELLCIDFASSCTYTSLSSVQPKGFHVIFQLFKLENKTGRKVMYMPNTLLIKQRKTKKCNKIF